MSCESESSSLTHRQQSGVCMSGGLHSLVCQICNGDEGNSLFASEAAKRCKQTLETHTKEKKHSCSICVRIGLIRVCVPPPPTPTLPLLFEIKKHGEEGSPAGLLRRTSVCFCSCVYFLCVVHTVFVCQTEGAFPSRSANHLY